jgi:hypothetical protein
MAEYADNEFYTDVNMGDLEELDADRGAFMQKSPDLKVLTDYLFCCVSIVTPFD